MSGPNKAKRKALKVARAQHEIALLNVEHTDAQRSAVADALALAEIDVNRARDAHAEAHRKYRETERALQSALLDYYDLPDREKGRS